MRRRKQCGEIQTFRVFSQTPTVTPFERPIEFAGKEFLTEKEVADWEALAAKSHADEPPREGETGTYNEFWDDHGTKAVSTRRSSLIIDPPISEWEALAAKGHADEPPREGETGTYNEFWDDHGTKAVSTRRSSLIIDPPDGRIPPLTKAALKLIAARAEIRREHGFDGPEYRPINERCLWRASTGPPIFPVAYNNTYRITQAPGYVVILSEMIHDARLIPLDGRPHLPHNIGQYLGDSRGHWEGNTLVVETTNFNDQTKMEFGRPPFSSIRGIGDARVIERFSRTAAD